MLLQIVQPGDLVFYAFGLIAILGAAGAALSKNLVYSAFALLAALLGVAALFAWLSADYVAITQLVVYVGGILVLLLFAIMLTHKIGAVGHSNPTAGRVSGAVISLAIFALLSYVAVATPWRVLENSPADRPTTPWIGNALLTTYILPFEVLSVVLLGAMIGAVLIARKEVKDA